MEEEIDVRCQRCGKCCHLKEVRKNGSAAIITPTMRECPYLVRFSSGRTLCKVYNHRLGRELPMKNKCVYRKQDIFRYTGCPYNAFNKETDPLWDETVGQCTREP